MNKLAGVVLIVALSSMYLVSCKKAKYDIVKKAISEILEVPHGLLQSEPVIATMQPGQVKQFEKYDLDINGDGILDITFQVVDLTLWNGVMPNILDNMATRAFLYNGAQVMDNSTWGYADALTDEEISKKSTWSTRSITVLGTINDAGRFEGKGDRYLGVRIEKEGDYYYGWVKLNCSPMSDTLHVKECAINFAKNKAITAGQY